MEVKIVAHSKSPSVKELVTYELEYPRFIHAELMTHRVFSRNGQSSRAVPVQKSLTHPPVYPISWGENRAGMSSNQSLSKMKSKLCAALWGMSAYVVRASCKAMARVGLHKQWANRPLEWQQNIKVIVSSTEWDNFFKLRLDSETVQPEFVQLAKMMKDAKDSSVPQELPPGAWHLPYVRTYIGPVTGKILYYVDGVDVCLESAKKISVAACAQVSYRTLDLSLEKAGKIIKMLTKSDDPHLSPFEHLATPMMETQYPDNDDWDFDGYNVPYQTETWQEGITHADRHRRLWSGNFQGWIQNRQLMEV